VWVWSLSLHVVFSILHELSAILQAFQAKAWSHHCHQAHDT
jgi:hypothetical protein